MTPLRILIVGAGIAGPTLASFLLLSPGAASEKPHITILERAPQPRTQGQSIDIRGAGVSIIRKLGLETAIRSSVTGEEGVRFVDAQNRAWASFAADKSGKEQTGTSDLEILRGRLADICLKRCGSLSHEIQRQGGQGVKFIFGDYLQSIDQDGSHVHVVFAKSGQKQTFDLVVGADGLQSRTRSLVWGAENEAEAIKSLNMYIGFFTIPSGPTDTIWRRWFHAPGRKGIMLRPHETSSRTSVNMSVLSETDARLRQVASDGRKGIAEQKALLSSYFQDEGWECPRLIKELQEADDFYYSEVSQVHMPRWSKGRVVLLGDAGYCASPISGMGTTLALSGAYNLAGAISRHAGDLEAAFEGYHEKMRPTVDLAQKLKPGMPKLMWPETAWGIVVMHLIFAFVYYSGLAMVMFRVFGPGANMVEVEEYGFRQLEDWKGYKKE